MRRLSFGILVLAVALVAPWPLSLALAAAGAAVWPLYVESALVLAVVEGAATPDRSGPAWLPLAAAALVLAATAELVRPRLVRAGRLTV